MRRNDLGYLRPVFLRDHAGGAIREELICLPSLGRSRQTHPDRNRAVIALQPKRPFEPGLLVVGERQEADDGFARWTGAAVPRAGHIPVGLPGEVLVSVVGKDELDQSGRFPLRAHVGV